MDILSYHNSSVYSIGYGTADGKYFGVERSEKEILAAREDFSNTIYDIWNNSVNETMVKDYLFNKVESFDSRTQNWYRRAVSEKTLIFSQVYKHFEINDLTISASYPVYDNDGELEGVLVVHMLLLGIEDYIKDIIKEFNGYALILEKDTGYLIANSVGFPNYTILENYVLKRNKITEVDGSDIQSAFAQYYDTGKPYFLYKGKNERLHVNANEIHMNGINWVVISAIPESLYMTNIIRSIYLTIILVVLALSLSLFTYRYVTIKLLKPMDELLNMATAISLGDLSKRVKVVRQDEIGLISNSFNNVADKVQFLINNLEESVDERTKELHKVNISLEENKKRLQLILNSTIEGIFGIDLEGRCTFVNTSAIKILGFTSEKDLLGKNIHSQIHHSYGNKKTMPIEDCKITKSINEGVGVVAGDEVFWRADGTYFDAEYHAYPQIVNGEIVGGVVTFMDITDRKIKEDEIEYISIHDTLTGLLNRRGFEISSSKLDTMNNLPLSIIFADINGLKMTNDIFGHAAGDELIKKSAEILKKSCRDRDIIARVGGDEFIILLPNTNKDNAKRVLERIRDGFMDAHIEAIKCSVSVGSCTKTNHNQSLEKIVGNAEDEMYKDKTLNRRLINKDMINTIISTLHEKHPKEKEHSIRVSQIAKEFGEFLKLSKSDISKVERAAYLHDIGKITLDENVAYKTDLTENQKEIFKQHSVIGYRILNLFEETMDIAEYVYSHHELWNGEGYPRGLKEEQIPLLSRMISIVDRYDRIYYKGDMSLEDRQRNAINNIRDGMGTIFDPEIGKSFIDMINDKNKII